MGVPGIEINGDWSRWVILLAEQIGPFVFSGAERQERGRLMRNCETINETLRQKLWHYFFFCKCKKRNGRKERRASERKKKGRVCTACDWWKIDVNCCDRGIMRLPANVFGHMEVEERGCSLRKLRKSFSGRIGARKREIGQLLIGSCPEIRFFFPSSLWSWQ